METQFGLSEESLALLIDDCRTLQSDNPHLLIDEILRIAIERRVSLFRELAEGKTARAKEFREIAYRDFCAAIAKTKER